MNSGMTRAILRILGHNSGHDSGIHVSNLAHVPKFVHTTAVRTVRVPFIHQYNMVLLFMVQLILPVWYVPAAFVLVLLIYRRVLATIHSTAVVRYVVLL